ncbi:hypothetical protein FPANT_2440 [Fusarium pseudoanthophilum]|uniref:Uncharacterized protein n=1 Tax=Fusarium pseudoanthophilum TaxID=48495 RepID=A0A8H5UWW8_9HYPO|nr:hypothetical protein FPANT_2440 [Fusarium pseudoanthophilum]
MSGKPVESAEVTRRVNSHLKLFNAIVARIEIIMVGTKNIKGPVLAMMYSETQRLPIAFTRTFIKDFEELIASLRNLEPSTQAQQEPSSSTTVGASSRGPGEGQHEELTSIAGKSYKAHPPPPPPGSPPLENRLPTLSSTEQIPRHRGKGNRGTGGSQERSDKRPSDARPTGQSHKKWRDSSRK